MKNFSDISGLALGASRLVAEETPARKGADIAVSENEFRALAEALPHIIWITRPDGGNVFFNRQWVEYTGLTLEESYGDGGTRPFHPDDRKKAWDAWQSAVKNTATYSLECRLRRADGAYRWWLVRGAPLLNENGSIEKWFCTCTDIHDVAWRNQIDDGLRAARAEADAAILAKSKFLAAVTHDLRQPVQSLVFLLAVLKRQALAPAVEKAVAMMEHALEGLNNLLSSTLDLSRIDAGVVAPHFEDVDIDAMVRRLAGEYAPRCQAKRLRLARHCSPGLHTRTDPAQLERILRNIIENAVRCTERGGLFIAARRRGERLRIDILDTGVGIPQDKLPHIFEEFYQVGNPARDHKQGLGLGLAIVKRLARLLGAEVQAASRVGRGTRFTISLPVVAPTALLSASGRAEDFAGRRILVIEDNPKVRAGFQLLLETWDCKVICAESGEEAVQLGAGEAWRFDAIIADYRLGAGMSGTQTAAEIAARAGRPIPTLIVTGDTAPERIGEIHASGFEMMHKPVMPDELARRPTSLFS
jgi:PAS domain S-box-containing protein